MENDTFRTTRRDLLRNAAALGVALPLGGALLAACGSSSKGSGGSTTLNWLTWSDHFANDQLKAVSTKTGITGRPKLFSDNADAILQIKQLGDAFDMVSGDALWDVKYMTDGLIDPMDLGSIDASKELYSIAKSFDFWTNPKGYLGYPFSWSTVQIYYNPDMVKTPPSSWQSLTDPAYKGMIVAENIPTDLLAIAGRAGGVKDPYGMTPTELSGAADFLAALKPNLLKLASQNNEVIQLLANKSVAIGVTNLGSEDRVKDAGGPVIKAVYPSEGTIGFIDSEMIVSKGKNKQRVPEFLDAMERSDYIAQNFITNGRPLFNESAAKKLLADSKTADRAKRLFMDQPEKALEMTLKGPAGDQQAYTEAFNKVFGA
ncbi:MAG: spermidine/putrescine transport system substrate-binding protein [Ilumatobacteraceae bacterium]|nr:spermidine/putrescine transport system substrate-binding protein [Ilumatobacteraceae bacterium]